MVYKREYPMLGGRRLKPAFEPISEEPPTADELRWSDKLWNYMQEASPQETLAEQQARANIMHQITTMFREWVHSVCLSKGLPPEVAERAGGQVFTSGSYRLGVNEKSMDIDTICVAPRHVTREDFFSSLKVILEDHDSVENLSAIEGATVPIITFDFDGVNIDLLFASLPVDSVPEDFDVNDDEVLRGVDVGTEKSLNGPRVTEMITKLVPNYDAFLAVVRCIRLWAKKRGLYSNKMGYLGGVNCNLLVAFVCQLYPRAAAARLLERFFSILKDWKWPTPIMLTPPYDAGLGLEVWDPAYGNNRYHTMPILTPAYPSMNSSMSVSRGTLEVMRAELALGHERVKQALERGSEGWEALFAEPNFVVAHSKYLAVEIFASGLPPHDYARQLQSWQGLVESRLRKLTDAPYLANLPLANIRLMPKKLPLLTVRDAQGGAGNCYLVGFDVDKERMQGNELHITAKVEAFKDEVNRTALWQGIVTEASVNKQLRLKFSTFASWKDLPDAALQGVGGRAAAKALRKQLVAQRAAAAIADPDAAQPTGAGAPSGAQAASTPAPTPSRDPRVAPADPRLRDPRLAAMRAVAADGPPALGGAEATAGSGGAAGGALGVGPAKRPAEGADAAPEGPAKMQRTTSLPEVLPGNLYGDHSPEAQLVGSGGPGALQGRGGKFKLTLAS